MTFVRSVWISILHHSW